jgi:hypothetical protein
VPDTEERERTNYATPWNSVSRVKGRVDWQWVVYLSFLWTLHCASKKCHRTFVGPLQ